MGLGLAGLGIGTPSTPVGVVEVRFEWKRRTDKKKKSKKATGSAQGSRRASLLIEKRSNTSLNNGASPVRDLKEKADKERKTNNRLSVISHRSVSTTITSEDHPDTTKDDDGEDSDPEDSETPWTCTLKMRRLPPPSTPRMLSARMPPPEKEKEKDQVIRIKVGTLSPTPHHPKVVAMLKIPFPLPDLDVEKMHVKRRVIGANGVVLRPMGSGEENGGLSPVPEGGERHGMMLTAEEIKDIVSSTGLWLVVREGFGGVGRVNRKGDGWRIRA